jgi:hypothetical protein
MAAIVADISLGERYEFACKLSRRVGLEALEFWNECGSDGLGTKTK